LGKSQKIISSMVKFIEEHGGKVMLQTRVEKIFIEGHSAYGVRVEGGKEYTAKVMVSNANAYNTFHNMMSEEEHLKSYLERMNGFTSSLSYFQVFLGLNKDLIQKTRDEKYWGNSCPIYF